ncbi:uncharacterized protein LY79DRAFT_329683 [Colletotrichum navitas]|uniref:Uncharacterized protein n=1 Tax=Colletotrichum navitas TaxID=681940 RepID=A0AAD8V2Q5_9PEZI|nr:uncharacterized protein LY79DRAFT_329683 [Colletotrichum navitas]KAK1579953.1 hypothetical protein LY79DRAFT_329683 [Colletotrichum navitas]
MKYWLPSPSETHDSRVTLARDAAHPMLPCKSGLDHKLNIRPSLHYIAICSCDIQSGDKDCNMPLSMCRSTIGLTQLRGTDSTINREEIVSAYGLDVVERGCKAVVQSLKEAGNSLDINTVGQTVVATQGHGISV